MIVGVVSDTHNNSKNIDKIISLFNNKSVDLVVHTGDITSSKTLQRFSALKCCLCGVYGNNDRYETGLEEIARDNGFIFQNPPLKIERQEKTIVVFHEPDLIENFLKDNQKPDIILHGHTHRYREETSDNILFFNPGESAGILEGKNAVGIIDLTDLSVERILF